MRRRRFTLGAVAAALCLAGCGGGAEVSESGPQRRGAESPPRLVSLSPAITRTLLDLGVGEWVVGRTPYCRGLPGAVPAVGSLLEIDHEALRAVGPEWVLVQPPARGVDPGLERTATQLGWRIETFRIDRLGDLEALLDRLPALLAGAVGAAEADRLQRRAADLRARLEAASRPLAAPPEGVLVLFSLDPPMAFGRGTFVGEHLDRLGVANALPRRGYPELSLEDLVQLDPSAVILLREQVVERDPWARLRGLALPALERDRVRVLAHPEALTPGSGWIGAAEALRDALQALGPAEGDP